MLLALYCWVNAGLYALFAAWCVLAEERTSQFVGLSPINAGGRSEYWAVYGGLQAGLGVFYLLAALAPEHRRTALIFSLCLYGGIVAFRTCAAFREGFGNLGNAWFTYPLEISMLVAAVALFLARTAKP